MVAEVLEGAVEVAPVVAEDVLAEATRAGAATAEDIQAAATRVEGPMAELWVGLVEGTTGLEDNSQQPQTRRWSVCGRTHQVAVSHTSQTDHRSP